MRSTIRRRSTLWMGLCFACCMFIAMGFNAKAASQEFIKGMDLSSLEAIEDAGGIFYDEQGNAISDILEYLVDVKDVNYVRLRVWNNPTTSFDAGDYCSPEHTVEMAQRIKEAGLKLLIDFHYSDTWADPANQTKPAAWQNLTFTQLTQAVYDFTSDVLNDLNDVGAYPDMVQIGNEISGGMLWSDGYVDNMSNLCTLLGSGISAVRDTTPADQETLIMIHLAEGGDVERFEWYFDSITAGGVNDFDVIGMSYYSYWHGPLSSLKENMNYVSARYGKYVVVAETSYPYTYTDADSTPNIIGESDTDVVGLPASVANQKLMTEMTFNTVANVSNDKGLGVFYWEPLWIAVDGVGVSQGVGNEWDNQVLFGANHWALDSLNAFLFDENTASANNSKHVIVYSPKQVIVQVDEYTDIRTALPSTVEVLTYDGSLVELPVTWSNSQGQYNLPVGDYTFTGAITGLDPLSGVTPATPSVEVLVQRNLVNNASFEDENTQDWTINRITGEAGKITKWDDSYAYSGEGSFQYWYDDVFSVELYQKVAVEPGHTYDFSVWAQGTYDYIDYANSYFFVRYTDSNNTKVVLDTVELMNANYSWWNQFTMTDIVIPAGVVQVEIGGIVSGTAGGYGTWDDFVFKDQVDSVIPDSIFVANGDFEAETTSSGSTYASMDSWTINVGSSGWPTTCWATSAQNHTSGGKYAFQYYNKSAFSVQLSQTVTGLASGYYTLDLFSYGSNDSKTVTLQAVSNGITYTAVIQDTNQWANNAPVWVETMLKDIQVSNGTVEITITIQGASGSWGYLDDISLVRQ